MDFNRNRFASKIKDFSRLLQAVTYNVKVVVYMKWGKIDNNTKTAVYP